MFEDTITAPLNHIGCRVGVDGHDPEQDTRGGSGLIFTAQEGGNVLGVSSYVVANLPPTDVVHLQPMTMSTPKMLGNAIANHVDLFRPTTRKSKALSIEMELDYRSAENRS